LSAGANKSIDAVREFRLDESVKKKTFILSICAALLSLVVVCPALARHARIEQALRDLDAQWSVAAGAKDLDKTVSYYADNAIVMPPNAPAATTKEAVRAAWKDFLALPGLALSWKATHVEVAAFGDMAWMTGTYEMMTKDAGGKSTNDHGKYLEVWKKQADGKWKVVADIWNSDLPAANAPTEQQ
jgi:ketosteroid isomerase-like protein